MTNNTIQMNRVKINVTKELAAAVKLATSIVSKKSSLKSIEHVMFTFKSYEITVTSMNFVDRSLYFQQTVDMPNELTTQEFSVLVHKDSLKGLKAKTEAIFGPTFATIGGVQYKSTFTPSDFPKFPQLETDRDKYTHLPNVSKQYFDDIAQIANSAATSELRPVLTGIYHNSHNIVATDGLRLMQVQSEHDFQTPFNLPANIASFLQKAFKDQDDATLLYDQKHAQFHRNGVLVVTGLIDGKYPDTHRIIPQTFKTEVTLHSQSIIEACKAVIQANAKTDNCVMQIEMDGDFELNITARNKETGAEFNGSYTSRQYGSDLVICCNAKYLLTAIEQMNSEHVKIQFNSSAQPFVVKPEHGSIHDKLALVSPVLNR